MIYLHTLPEPLPGTVFARKYRETVGGTAAGKALNLNHLGLDVTLYHLIGDDANSQHIKAYLREQKLQFEYDTDPAGTQRHVNLMADDGGRLSIYANAGTFEPDIDLNRLTKLIENHDYLILNISNYSRWLIEPARKAGKAIWCDLHDYDGQNPYHKDFVAGADYLFMSSGLMPDYHEFMQYEINAGKKLVVCTHGANGASALGANGKWYEVPAITDYELVDSNGAGDSFFAGYFYGHLKGLKIEKCLQLATICARLCITSTELFYPELSTQNWKQIGGITFRADSPAA